MKRYVKITYLLLLITNSYLFASNNIKKNNPNDIINKFLDPFKYYDENNKLEIKNISGLNQNLKHYIDCINKEKISDDKSLKTVTSTFSPYNDKDKIRQIKEMSNFKKNASRYLNLMSFGIQEAEKIKSTIKDVEYWNNFCDITPEGFKQNYLTPEEDFKLYKRIFYINLSNAKNEEQRKKESYNFQKKINGMKTEALTWAAIRSVIAFVIAHDAIVICFNSLSGKSKS